MKANIIAFIQEEKRHIIVWNLQVGMDCYFVQELDNEKVYTVSSIDIRLS